MTKSELITIRGMTLEDKSFIYATFLRGLYHGDSIFSLVPKQIFMENYHKVIDLILSRPDNQVRIACLKDDPTVILGYSILAPTALIWVHVKKNWRKIGIAKDLVPSDITTVTHLNKVGASIANKKGLTFNPFII